MQDKMLLDFLDKFNRLVNKQQRVNKNPVDYGTGVKMFLSEMYTLSAIAAKEGINLTELAQYQGVSRSAISQVVIKLEKKGMIVKKQKWDNKKEIILFPSNLGRETIKNFDLTRERIFAVLAEKLHAMSGKAFHQLEDIVNHIDELMDKKLGI